MNGETAFHDRRSTICPCCEQRTWALFICHHCNGPLDRAAPSSLVDAAVVHGASKAVSRANADHALWIDAQNLVLSFDKRRVEFLYRGYRFTATVRHRFATGLIIENMARYERGRPHDVAMGPKLIRINGARETSWWKYIAEGLAQGRIKLHNEKDRPGQSGRSSGCHTVRGPSVSALTTPQANRSSSPRDGATADRCLVRGQPQPSRGDGR